MYIRRKLGSLKTITYVKPYKEGVAIFWLSHNMIVIVEIVETDEDIKAIELVEAVKVDKIAKSVEIDGN